MRIEQSNPQLVTLVNGILRIKDIKYTREELLRMSWKQLNRIYSEPEKYMK